MNQGIGSKRWDTETWGTVFGFLGVLSFSLTLPATRVAVADLDATFVGLGRAVVASVLALIALGVTRQPLPPRQYWRGLGWVAIGVILGFPLLSAVAMRHLPASHGAVVIGLIPLATAIVTVMRSAERPSRQFWLAGVIGSATIVTFTVMAGRGQVQLDDLLLLGAVAAAAIGYAEGGKLAQVIGGWQVICWALVISAPVLVIPVFISAFQHGLQASPISWLGFGYVCVVSQFLGFFAWYHGMSLAGVSRVSQLQLLQPFMTLVFSAFLLHEEITPMMIGAAGIVIACVVVGRRSRIYQKR